MLVDNRLRIAYTQPCNSSDGYSLHWRNVYTQLGWKDKAPAALSAVEAFVWHEVIDITLEYLS